MKSVWIVQYLASNAIRLQEDKYALQQQQHLKPNKKNKLFNPSFTYKIKSKSSLKSCILGSNFVGDLAQVSESEVHCLVQ